MISSSIRHRSMISIHALRGEGDFKGQEIKIPNTISIHALRGEGDFFSWEFDKLPDNFNPRPPWGGRRFIYAIYKAFSHISIHALRGEGDSD